MLAKRKVRIRGSGVYLPRRRVTAEDIDFRQSWTPGTAESISGVKQRYFAAADETSSRMGALACMAALEDAGLRYEELDAIVYVSGSVEQAIPCTAALVQKQLGKEKSGTPCFDINSTCLSFVTGLDLISYLLDAGRFRNVALISSEIASVGLNWEHRESCCLFGDGAVAMIVGRCAEGESSGILASRMETYSSGSEACEIQGGGTRVHPRNFERGFAGRDDDRFLFAMNGRKVFKLASQVLPGFMTRLFQGSDLTVKDLKLVVPHQASLSGMELLRRRLELPEEKWMSIIQEYGNMIAASIPMALHVAIREKRIQRGDRVLLIGTSAGLSIGGLIFEY